MRSQGGLSSPEIAPMAFYGAVFLLETRLVTRKLAMAPSLCLPERSREGT